MSSDNESHHDASWIIKLRGLPWTVTSKDILNFLEDVNIVDGENGVHLITYSRNHTRPNGEAFVECASADDYKKAFKFDKKNMGHRYIEIFSAKQEDFETIMRKQNIVKHDTVVKLRGLPWGVTEKEIETFFEGLELNQDTGIHIQLDRSGRASGEAFVQFETEEDCEKALKRNLEKIGHRYIEIFRSSSSELRRAMTQQFGNNRATPYDRNGRGDRGNPRGMNMMNNMRNLRGGNNDRRGGRDFFDPWDNRGNNFNDNFNNNDNFGNGNRFGGNNGFNDNFGGGGGNFGNGGGNCGGGGFNGGFNNGSGFNNGPGGFNGGGGGNGGGFGGGNFGNGMGGGNNGGGGGFGNNFGGGGGGGGNGGGSGGSSLFGGNGNNNGNRGGGGGGGGGGGSGYGALNTLGFGGLNNLTRGFGNNGNGGGGGSNSGGGGGGGGGNGGFSCNNFGGNNNGNDFDPETDGFCVHLRGMPYYCDDLDIYKFFAPLKPVHAKVIYNNKGMHSGGGNAYFASHDEAMQAMKKDKDKMGSRYIELFYDSPMSNNRRGKRF